MKKILFVSPNLGNGGGGAERQIVTVACLLKNSGYEVEFLCYCDGDFYYYILEQQHIPVYWKISSSYWKRMISVRKFIRRGKYDVVISFLDTPNFLNNFAALGGKRWKVITGERSAKEEHFLSRRGKVFAWFQRFADGVVCNSENARNMWRKYYPNYTDKLFVIYNSVNLPPVTSTYYPKREGKLHILIAASYQYLKNPINLIKAISMMSEEDKKRLVVDWYGRAEITKGDTQCYDEVVQFVQENKLQEVVHLNFSTDHIQHKINEADVVALFSWLEGLPNVICEGMTIGKPIVMTRVSDYDVLIDETNGFLCDWNDVESIKRVLIKVIHLDRDELLSMGNCSRQKAIELFSRERVINSWINLIEDIL